MKWLNALCALCLMWIFGISYYHEQHPQVKYNSLEHRFKYPFDTRVRYRIGTIDPRFGLSRQQVEQVVNEAIDIWHQGTGKQWFVYDDDAQLTINFLYDDRQQRTIDVNRNKDKLQHLEQQRQQQRASIEPEKQRLQQKFQEIMAQRQQYQADVKQYEYLYQHYAQQHQLHQHHVQQQLSEMHHQLQRQERDLNDAINRFKMEETSLNFKIDQFNQLTDQRNQTVNVIKQRFPPHEFHKGIFNGTVINIYQYWSMADLRLTLAHEFGHALDLDHHQDPQGLMYPVAQEQNLEQFRLMPSDIALLKQR